jgi:uncharacterized protein YPO0396
MALDPSRFKVPAGSLLMDGALVVALVWSGATMTERLEQIAHRVSGVEVQQQATRTSDARIMVLERRADEMSEYKLEMREQLNRIEDKIDKLNGQALR